MNLVVFRRYSGTKQLVVIANFANADYTGYRIGLPLAGDWTEALNSQASAYDGDGFGNPGGITAEAIPSSGFAQSAAINIPRLGLVLLAPAGIPLGVNPAPFSGAGRVRFASIVPAPERDHAAVEFVLPRPTRARITVLDAAAA